MSKSSRKDETKDTRTFVPKGKKVPMKVSPVSDTVPTFVAAKNLPGSFVVIVASDKGVNSFTYHHPVGITPLDDDEWIVTPTRDVHFLLDRATNPNEKKVYDQRNAMVMDLALQGGIFKQDEGGDIIYKDGGSRKAFLAALRKDGKGKNIDPTTIGGGFGAAELAFKKLKEETRRLVEETIPLPDFTTRGGPLGDREQVPIAALKGMNSAQAGDAITKSLFSLPSTAPSKDKSRAPTPKPKKKVRGGLTLEMEEAIARAIEFAKDKRSRANSEAQSEPEQEEEDKFSPIAHSPIAMAKVEFAPKVKAVTLEQAASLGTNPKEEQIPTGGVNDPPKRKEVEAKPPPLPLPTGKVPEAAPVSK